MRRIVEWLKRETVLAAAWLLALISMVFVPPDGGYRDYMDFRTLGLLFSLMAVMAGLQGLGLFRRLGDGMLRRTGSTRQLEAVLIFLPFFTSMAVTNDVALITFVPFALEVLRLADREDRLVPVVVMQTIAANLGSMATPIGNPQNLYLCARYELDASSFLRTMLPLTLASAALLGAFLLLEKSAPLPVRWRGGAPAMDRRRLALYGVLFAGCLCAVGRRLPVGLLVCGVLIAVLAADRAVLRRVDWSLLLTFAGFFIFVGNLGRMEALSRVLRSVLLGHEALCAVALSQIISNVPAALLLSGFTEDGAALLAGTNLGGLGTLIASMASLISYKQIARNAPALRGRYLRWFTAANVLFLAVLLGLYALLR